MCAPKRLSSMIRQRFQVWNEQRKSVACVIAQSMRPTFSRVE